MVFDLNNKEYKVDLNSTDQTKLKELFYDIIILTFSEYPTFELSEESKDYDNKLFVDISSEYLKGLNSEIDKIISNKPAI